ncbi:MAG: hypothetical protein H3C35_09625 [Bacteroidetes bacterium]|nr:hypothetical protein [Bacteroidota bacterium]
MFKLIGIAAALYVLYAVISGKVYTKSGVWGKTILRKDDPEYFWFTIVIYAGVSLALFFYF